jgi:SAM-dependent methyltransferase
VKLCTRPRRRRNGSSAKKAPWSFGYALHLPVPLRDVVRLASLPEPALRGLGQRLRVIGLTPAFLAQLARVGDRLDDPLRAPMRVWNARRMSEPAAAAVRLFMLHDAVSPAEARAALGELAPLRDVGLLEETDAGVASGFHLALAADLFLFGDRPASHVDAVMPVCGATLDLVRAAMPHRSVGSALDVGCGAGAVGLLLARAAQRVVATDVSERALLFTRINAALNGISNVELRAGDLFGPVRGERYDLVVAQPPFVARREGAPPSSFVHGGVRGDELALRLLGEAPSAIGSAGRALVLADWPIAPGDVLDARLRSAVASAAVDLLVLQSPPKNLDDYCALHAAVEHPELGAEFQRAAIAQRDHFERLGVRAVAVALVVVEPAARAGAGWTSLLAVRHGSDAPISAAAIDRLVAARRLVYGGADAVLASRLRVPEGSSRLEQPASNGAPPSVIVKLPAGRPEWPIVLDAESADIVERVAGAPTVRDAARLSALDRTRVEQVARGALLSGALEIAR